MNNRPLQRWHWNAATGTDYSNLLDMPVSCLPLEWYCPAIVRLRPYFAFYRSAAGTLPAGMLRSFASDNALKLDLSNNRLSGHLPALTYTPPPIQIISIGRNQLEGSIPDSWSSLMLSSISFDARMLRLSGTLPSNFMNSAPYE